MSGYHNNLALHVVSATEKGRRRLSKEPRIGWPAWFLAVCASVLAVAAWQVASAYLEGHLP